jgi:hypothetical protein
MLTITNRTKLATTIFHIFTYFLIQKDKKMSIKPDTITSFFLPFSCLFFFSNEIHRNAGQDDLNARIAFPSLICILFYLKKGNNF